MARIPIVFYSQSYNYKVPGGHVFVSLCASLHPYLAGLIVATFQLSQLKLNIYYYFPASLSYFGAVHCRIMLAAIA